MYHFKLPDKHLPGIQIVRKYLVDAVLLKWIQYL